MWQRLPPVVGAATSIIWALGLTWEGCASCDASGVWAGWAVLLARGGHEGETAAGAWRAAGPAVLRGMAAVEAIAGTGGVETGGVEVAADGARSTAAFMISNGFLGWGA